jgi:ABC-type glycerol-3-phosphate transport system substrate-binding protein
MRSLHRSRRRFLRSAALVGAAGVLAACAGTPSTPTAGAPSPAPAQKADASAAAPSAKPGAIGGGLSGTIELYFPRTAVCRLCASVDIWNEEHPNARVVDKDVPWSGEKQLAALAAGQGGPDLYQSDPQEVQRDMLGRKLLDLTEVVQPSADQYLKYKIEQFRHAKTGKIYAFPWQVAMSVTYYRDDILKKLGMNELPNGWTWDDHELLAEKAKKDLNLNTCWVGAGQNDKDTTLFCEMLWQAGGSIVSKDGTQVLLDSPISVEVMQRLQRWWKKGLLFEGSFYTPPLWSAMRQGILWSTTDVSAWMLGMRDNITKPEDHVGDWRVAPMPAWTKGGPRTAGEGGGGLASPAHTKNPDLVKAFGKFTTTDLRATMPTMQQGTVLSALSSFTDPKALDITFSVTGPQKVHQVYAELIKEMPTTYYLSPGWAEVRHVLAQAMLSVVRGETDAAQGMKKIAEDARKVNDRWVKLLAQE